MTDFSVGPVVTVRQHPKFTITSDGVRWYVDGALETYVSRHTILDNPHHYLRKPLAALIPKLESGEIAGFVLAGVDGKPAQIMITREQFAAVAAEAERYHAWQQGRVARETDRLKKEREYDLGANEGGEGYNPHRRGSAPTYQR